MSESRLRRRTYFSSCHPFIPILHEPTFSFLADEMHVNLSVLALASRHHDEFASKAEIFYSLAKQTTQATLLTPTIHSLTALLLQAVYEIGHPNTSLNALSTLGSAIALVSAFRLMRLDEEPWRPSTKWLQKPKDWIEEEQRRRTALMTLSLSRWIAAIQGREFGIHAKSEIKLLLPVSDSDWFSGIPIRPQTDLITSMDLASTTSPLARWVQVLGLFSIVHGYKQSVSNTNSNAHETELYKLDSKLERFIRSFPEECKQIDHVQGERLLDITTLSLAHCCCLLLHNSPPSSDMSELSQLSRQRTSAHAEDILDIASTSLDHPELGNYMLPHCHILAARVRLSELLARKGTYKGRDMKLLIKCLLTFGKRWGLQDKLALHAARIEANEVPFSEPLTTFEPTTNIKALPKQRQKSTSLVRPRGPSSKMKSRFLDTCIDGDTNDRMMASTTDLPFSSFSGELDEQSILREQPMDWSTGIWDFESASHPYI